MNIVARITKKMANISSVSQQYHNLFNFKEPKKETTQLELSTSQTTFLLSVRITTTSLTSRKQKNQATQLELSRTLENNSFISQEYYSFFNFKEAKESNNSAGITKNAGEHFLCQSRILQLYYNNTTRILQYYNSTVQLKFSRTLQNIFLLSQE